MYIGICVHIHVIVQVLWTSFSKLGTVRSVYMYKYCGHHLVNWEVWEVCTCTSMVDII